MLTDTQTDLLFAARTAHDVLEVVADRLRERREAALLRHVAQRARQGSGFRRDPRELWARWFGERRSVFR